MPNVKLFFNHKLTGADFRRRKAWFEVKGEAGTTGRAKEIEVGFDLMLGADGAHSAVRFHLMKFTRMDYHQEYIDTLWCEFQIQPQDIDKADHPFAKFKISPNHLHIWPGKSFMFIAIPSEVSCQLIYHLPEAKPLLTNQDGSFTCTLFLPSEQFAALEASPSDLPSFFDSYFPGVTSLIPPADLISSFKTNPHLPLISIKCQPFHYSSSVVILGDAAHAMVPFYGQGMNAGLEDVRILFSILDKHDDMSDAANAPTDGTIPSEDSESAAAETLHRRVLALAEYTAVRVPDAHAINDLALQNYTEMRASVLSPMYRLRKFLEEALSAHLPSLGWQTRYSRISFGNERYSEVVARTDHQGRVLVRGFVALVASPVLVGVGLLYWNRRGIAAAFREGGSVPWLLNGWRR